MAPVSGPFRRPDAVAVVEDAGVVYLGALPGGPISVLEGTAALIWAAALGRDAAGTVRAIADAVGRPAEEVRGDTERFLADLVARGLLADG